MSIDQASGQDTQTARLAAEIALDQPTLVSALRGSSARICKHAGLLEAELGHYRPLVGYLENRCQSAPSLAARPAWRSPPWR